MPIARAVFSGKLLGVQRWSIGINFLASGGTTPTPANMTTWANSLQTLFAADVWNAGSSPWSAKMTTGGNFDKVNTYWHDPSLAVGATVVGQSTGSVQPGTAGAPTLPPQCALCVSLLTALAGRAGRGRIYLPILASLSFATDGSVSTALSAVATNVAAFLTAANGTSVGGNTVAAAIAGATVSNPPLITTVRLDNVLDTQRRRRDKIVPTATSSVAV